MLTADVSILELVLISASFGLQAPPASAAACSGGCTNTEQSPGAAQPGRDSKVLFSKATGGRGRAGKVFSVPSCSSAAESKKQFQAIGGVERQKCLKNRNGN